MKTGKKRGKIAGRMRKNMSSDVRNAKWENKSGMAKEKEDQNTSAMHSGQNDYEIVA